MASVWKKGEHFYCQFLWHGRRRNFPLGEVTREDAERTAEVVGGVLDRVKRGEIRVADGADVVTFVRHRLAALHGEGDAPAAPLPTSPAGTLGALRDRYVLTHSNGTIEANSLATVRMHLNHFCRALGEKFPLDRLTAAELQAHVDRRAGAGLSPATLRKEVATFRAAWNWGGPMGLTRGAFPSRGLRYPKGEEKPPFQTFDEIARALAPGGLRGRKAAELWEALYLQPPEIKELLEVVKARAAHPWVYPLFAFAAHTGARRSEILRVRVGDVDFAGGTVLLREKKRTRGQRTTRRVPLTSQLVQALREYLEVHPGGEMLFAQGGVVARSKKRSGTTGHRDEKRRPSSLKGRLATVKGRCAVAACGVTRDECHDHFKRTLAGTKWEVLRGLHALRHSFISACASKGVDQRLIDEWVGHQTDEQRRRYRHLFPSVQREALEGVFG
ncbi:MAG: tyrosine-type recombinase/integrase [Gemmataceae bacterium]